MIITGFLGIQLRRQVLLKELRAIDPKGIPPDPRPPQANDRLNVPAHKNFSQVLFCCCFMALLGPPAMGIIAWCAFSAAQTGGGQHWRKQKPRSQDHFCQVIKCRPSDSYINRVGLQRLHLACRQ